MSRPRFSLQKRTLFDGKELDLFFNIYSLIIYGYFTYRRKRLYVQCGYASLRIGRLKYGTSCNSNVNSRVF